MSTFSNAIRKLRETLARQEAAAQATREQISAFEQLELSQDKAAAAGKETK